MTTLGDAKMSSLKDKLKGTSTETKAVKIEELKVEKVKRKYTKKSK